MCIEYIGNEKHWVDILSALAVPTIGVLGVYIAWRQWRTSAYRYKLDLFDKRLGRISLVAMPYWNGK